MFLDGICKGLSNSDCVTSSFAKSIGLEGKMDMASNDTIHSPASMVMPYIFSLEESYLHNLCVRDPIKDVTNLKRVSSLRLFGVPVNTCFFGFQL